MPGTGCLHFLLTHKLVWCAPEIIRSRFYDLPQHKTTWSSHCSCCMFKLFTQTHPTWRWHTQMTLVSPSWTECAMAPQTCSGTWQRTESVHLTSKFPKSKSDWASVGCTESWIGFGWAFIDQRKSRWMPRPKLSHKNVAQIHFICVWFDCVTHTHLEQHFGVVAVYVCKRGQFWNLRKLEMKDGYLQLP